MITKKYLVPHRLQFSLKLFPFSQLFSQLTHLITSSPSPPPSSSSSPPSPPSPWLRSPSRKYISTVSSRVSQTARLASRVPHPAAVGLWWLQIYHDMIWTLHYTMKWWWQQCWWCWQYVLQQTSVGPRLLCWSIWSRQRNLERAGLLIISTSSITVARNTWVDIVIDITSVVDITIIPIIITADIIGMLIHLKPRQSSPKESGFKIWSNPSFGRERNSGGQAWRLLVLGLVTSRVV